MGAYKTILIAGPTASGKSGLALALAKRFGGVIVNTDSMQVYRDLKLITARPSVDDEHDAPHRLYGDIDASHAHSTGAWLRTVAALLPQLREEFETTIFVGGTGLYFNALTLGLSQIPETPALIRQELRQQLQNLGPKQLHVWLAEEDGDSAKVLEPSDGQRIVRALEVLRHTGRPLRDWQSQLSAPLIDLDHFETKAIVLTPDRNELAEIIAARFLQMVQAGAMQEVETLLARNLDSQLPAMKAIGVKELGAAISGTMTLDSAINLAAIASRQYAKRQATWFRGQMGPSWGRYISPNLALPDFIEDFSK